ncbi:MAG: DNA-processing protein DprA [Lachnospiraceae bacterium]|nr:DNA-processing protein DprA [Candidatus Colinaster equi]
MKYTCDETEALCFLQMTPGIYNSQIKKLYDRFGSYVTAVTADESDYKKVLKSDEYEIILARREISGITGDYQNLRSKGINYCIQGSANFPKKLMNIPDAPLSLYYKGALPDDKRPVVAIIGARNCSGYGRQMAREYALELAYNGISVISGLARGIDALAENTAIDAGGISYGVLGSGIDICYPSQNRSLYDKAVINGGIISEYPPGTPARPFMFPQRNRIISGLSDAVIVIEARERSGTLITVNTALSQGKDVYALPGRTTDSLSYGCNKLIKDGAVPLLRPFEFIEEFRARLPYNNTAPTPSYTDGNKNVTESNAFGDNMFLTSNERMVMSVMDYNPKSAGEIFYEISEKATLTIPELLQILTDMTIQHKLKCIDGYNYCIYN